MKILSRVALLTIVVITFFGFIESDAIAQSCESSCETDCSELQGQFKAQCQRQCLGGRCQNQGIVFAAEATGEAGISCLGDGICNEFCALGVDPDCIPFIDGFRDGLVACLPAGSPAPDIVKILIDSEIIPSFFVVLNLLANNSCALAVCGELNEADFDPTSIVTEFIFNDGPVPAFCADFPRNGHFGAQATLDDPLNLGRIGNVVTFGTFVDANDNIVGWVQHLFLRTDPSTAIFSRASEVYRYR